MHPLFRWGQFIAKITIPIVQKLSHRIYTFRGFQECIKVAAVAVINNVKLHLLLFYVPYRVISSNPRVS